MTKDRGSNVEHDAPVAGSGRRERPGRAASGALSLQQTAGNRAVGGEVQRLQAEGGGELLVQRGILDWFKKKPPTVSGPTGGRVMRPDEQQGALSGKEVESKKKEDDRGLAGSKLTDAFAGTVLVYWRDPANKDKPLKDLGEFLLAEVNKSLGTLGSYACNSDMSATGSDSGAFARGTWTIKMNPARFTTTGATKVGEITQADVAELVDTVYHEARHSEQYFRIARIQAGAGKSAEQIKTGMSIPALVAKAAFDAPLKDEAPNRELIKEAGPWEAFTIGKYEVYKGKVASLRDATSELADVLGKQKPKKAKATKLAIGPSVTKIQNLFDSFFDAKLTEVEKIAKKDAADETVLKDLQAMKKTWTDLKAEIDKKKPALDTLNALRRDFYLARYTAYMNYEHEKDAWATGGAAAKSFKEAADKPVVK